MVINPMAPFRWAGIGAALGAIGEGFEAVSYGTVDSFEEFATDTAKVAGLGLALAPVAVFYGAGGGSPPINTLPHLARFFVGTSLLTSLFVETGDYFINSGSGNYGYDFLGFEGAQGEFVGDTLKGTALAFTIATLDTAYLNLKDINKR